MQPIYNPVIPYNGYIEGGFNSGRMVRIQGSINFPTARFAINLQCGPNTNPRDDIALHLSIRCDENCIVRNSLCAHQWGPEERFGGMPIISYQPFEIIILCEPTLYKIAVNGAHFADFPSRIPHQRVTNLAIDGSVTISFINFEGCYSTPGYVAPGVLPGTVPGPAYPHGPTYCTYPVSGRGPVSRVIGRATGIVSGVLGTSKPGHCYSTGYHGSTGCTPGMPGYVGTAPGVCVGTTPGAPLTKREQKRQKKAAKRALKYGLPVAGVGLGAYALHKSTHHKHHHHHRHGHKSSSSSSSSSSEEE